MKSLIVTLTVVTIILVASARVAYAEHKSPAMAGLMSFVLPGTGQFYTHQPQKGYVLLGAYVGFMSLVVASGPSTWEKAGTGELAGIPGTSSTTKMIWYGSVAVAGGALIYSVVDAIGAAKKINSGQISFAPYSTGGSSGLRVSLRTNW